MSIHIQHNKFIRSFANREMKKRLLLILPIFLLISSCNRLSNDFFKFLFNSEKISLSRECSDNPSFFSEGRSHEVYSIQEIDANLAVENIKNRNKFRQDILYSRYASPIWESTPVFEIEHDVYSFIESEMQDNNTHCYTKSELFKILQQGGNYFTFLKDDLDRVKLFIWDYKSSRLFLLTSYEV